MTYALTLTASSTGRAPVPTANGSTLLVDDANAVMLAVSPNPSSWDPEGLTLHREGKPVSTLPMSDGARWVLMGDDRFGTFQAHATAAGAPVDSPPVRVVPATVSLRPPGAPVSWGPAAARVAAPAAPAPSAGPAAARAATPATAAPAPSAPAPSAGPAAAPVATPAEAADLAAGAAPTHAALLRATVVANAPDVEPPTQGPRVVPATGPGTGPQSSTPTQPAAPAPRAHPPTAHLPTAPAPTALAPKAHPPTALAPSAATPATPAAPAAPATPAAPGPALPPASTGTASPQGVVEVPLGEYDGRFAAVVAAIFSALCVIVLTIVATQVISDLIIATPIPPDTPTPDAVAAARSARATSALLIGIGSILLLAAAALAALDVRGRQRRDASTGTALRGTQATLDKAPGILENPGRFRGTLALLITGVVLVMIGFVGQVHWS